MNGIPDGELWIDQKLLKKDKDKKCTVKCDLYFQFPQTDESFTAREILGNVADEFHILLAGSEEWQDIEVVSSEIRMEVCREPGKMRHKLYQLARSVLGMDATNLKILVLCVNGEKEKTCAAVIEDFVSKN